MKKEKTKEIDKIKKIEKKYKVKILKLFNTTISKSECNQCHDNCNDCGYDR